MISFTQTKFTAMPHSCDLILETSSVGSIFVEIVTQSIAFLFALFIFLIGLILDRRQKNKSNKAMRAARLQYFANLLDNSIKMVEEQNDSLQNVINEFNNELSENHLLVWNPKADLKRLTESIDQSDYYEAFVKETDFKMEEIEKFRKISKSLDYFNLCFNELWISSQKHVESDYSKRNEYKMLLEDSMDGFAKRIRTLEPEQYNELINFINERLLTVTQNNPDNSKIINFHNLFVEPIRKYMIQNHGEDEIFIEFMVPLKKLAYKFNNIIYANLSFKSDLEQILDTNTEVLAKLKTASKLLINDYSTSKLKIE